MDTSHNLGRRSEIRWGAGLPLHEIYTLYVCMCVHFSGSQICNSNNKILQAMIVRHGGAYMTCVKLCWVCFVVEQFLCFTRSFGLAKHVEVNLDGSCLWCVNLTQEKHSTGDWSGQLMLVSTTGLDWLHSSLTMETSWVRDSSGTLTI